MLAVVPSAVLLYAYSNGPEPRHTGAPGDDKLACASCHEGTPLNGGGGRVVVNFANGQTYTPGASQTFTVVITDATARVYGFQMTARLESNLSNGQAGDFTSGAQQTVICEDGSLKGRLGCPANAPLQFIEHTDPLRSNTFSVSWTAPAANVGRVHIYVAANAANNNGQNTGDHIYTADYVLTPAASGAPPSITKVISASAYSADAGLASGTWLEIYGSNFMTGDGRTWTGADFTGSKAPTSLEGIGVTINSVPAFVWYVSPTQLNVQAPDDPTVGPGIPIQVTTLAGKSNVFTMEKKAVAPALLAPSAFNVDGKQYVAAQFGDQTYVGKTGLVPGASFRPAKPGDIINIYGIGFGSVSPATPAGTIASGLPAIQPAPVFRIGNVTATLQYAGLTPGLVGLYQFNVVAPAVPIGDYPLTVDVGGVSANSGLFITVGQ